ncbi:hypothetical protein [Streptomyces paromomycinus]|uniref:Uncharacterized protein n=1 Tax=Streptomyces paromomycinus TaxID=92743 RepID=A0A401VXX6_STREY|nr:hypothetical protein [Streptomyces paromomycinus]GCD41912.1 hypothetical protein GKJPGBOP_01570 [Streptomyces paromomycinus]
MLSTPRGLLFWLVLIILLFCIAIAPVQTAHTVIGLIHAIGKFFAGLKAFLETLSDP